MVYLKDLITCSEIWNIIENHTFLALYFRTMILTIDVQTKLQIIQEFLDFLRISAFCQLRSNAYPGQSYFAFLIDGKASIFQG